jgi:two-component system phosphate regulon sensor histidine kinase PhoR
MGSLTAIRTRVFALTSLLLAVGMLVGELLFFAPLRESAEARERAHLEVRARLIADQLALRQGALEASPDLDNLARKLTAAAEVEVELALRDGRIVGRSYRTFQQLLETEPRPLGPAELEALRVGLGRSAVGQEWRVAVPWVHGGAVVGTVTLVGQLQSLQPLERVSRQVLVGTALGGLFLAVLIAVATAQLTKVAVARLGRVVQRMNAGESVRTGLVGEDAFAELGQGLDQLGAKLDAAQAELRAEKTRLERVLSAMMEGVLLVDADGNVQLANSAALEMLSIPPNPFGKPVTTVVENAQITTLLDEAPEGEHHTAELSLVHMPTRKILASARRLPQDTGVLAVFVDVTEQRRLETVRQEFVSNASHELRTPIAAIMSAVETLQSINAVTGDAERGFLDMIARNAQRLKALVDDLLALSHLESGAVEVQLEPVRLRSCVESIMNDLAPSARKRNTELISLVRSDLVVMASQRGLQHVLGNLMDNAIKYCPTDSRVTVEAHREGAQAVISVIDNGPGISEAHRERIFERFYRIDAGRSRALGGTGLGLSIVKHWVEAMGGSIRVTAGAGGGTAFRVALALSADKSDRSETALNPPV